jgi:hypothetical protein
MPIVILAAVEDTAGEGGAAGRGSLTPPVTAYVALADAILDAIENDVVAAEHVLACFGVLGGARRRRASPASQSER